MTIADRIRNGTATEKDQEMAGWLVHAVVQRGAYQLWEEAGRPEGMADHFWYLAEQTFIAFLCKYQDL